MSRNVYHEINLHLVWRTKGDVAVLVDRVEGRCHQYLAHVLSRLPESWYTR